MIASGTASDRGRFEGSEHCMTSDDIFTLEELPETMVVLGGGYIAFEMAQILNSLGVKVTVVVRSSPLKIVD